MSQLERIKEERNGKGKTTQKAQKTPEGLYNYHPTEADKKVLRELPWGVLEALDRLADYLEMGCRLSISPAKSNHAIMITIRAPGEDWQRCNAVSTAHSDINRGLITLAYALETRATEFPNKVPNGAQWEFDY
jgi:hypothetical protein